MNKKTGRPLDGKKKRVRLTVRVLPETKEKLEETKAAHNNSMGKAIDALVAEKIEPKLKTRRQVLSELPEPFKSQAISYVSVDSIDKVNPDAQKLSDAIESFIPWDCTNEGVYYWKLVSLGRYADALSSEAKIKVKIFCSLIKIS